MVMVVIVLHIGLGNIDLKVVVLAEVFQAQPDGLPLPELGVPGGQPPHQGGAVVSGQGHVPDGVVEGGAVRLGEVF